MARDPSNGPGTISSSTARIPLDRGTVEKYARRYQDASDGTYDLPIEEMVDAVKERGFLLKDEFERVMYWKSPMKKAWVAANDAEFVKVVTETALQTPSEQLRVEILPLLRGVAWPRASVILHWFHEDDYPILDIRAVWSLGLENIRRDEFPFWASYTGLFRQIASGLAVPKRTLDRALWQFSKENQR